MKDNRVAHNFKLDDKTDASVTYILDKTQHIRCVARLHDNENNISLSGKGTGLRKGEALANALNAIDDQLEFYLDKVDQLYGAADEELYDEKTELLSAEGLM